MFCVCACVRVCMLGVLCVVCVSGRESFLRVWALLYIHVYRALLCLSRAPSLTITFVAESCRVLQCVAVCCSVIQCVAACCSILQRVAVCYSVLQCVAACCSGSVCHCVQVGLSQ